MKKGELSMAMIIGAVIAIIILAIAVFLVARSSRDTNNATSCPSKGGVCTESFKCEPGKTLATEDGPINCPNAGEVCCAITSIR